MKLQTLLFSSCYGRRDFEIVRNTKQIRRVKIHGNYVYLQFYSKSETLHLVVFLVSTVGVLSSIPVVILHLRSFLFGFRLLIIVETERIIRFTILNSSFCLLNLRHRTNNVSQHMNEVTWPQIYHLC